jgi:hypothetical protein
MKRTRDASEHSCIHFWRVCLLPVHISVTLREWCKCSFRLKATTVPKTLITSTCKSVGEHTNELCASEQYRQENLSPSSKANFGKLIYTQAVKKFPFLHLLWNPKAHCLTCKIPLLVTLLRPSPSRFSRRSLLASFAKNALRSLERYLYFTLPTKILYAFVFTAVCVTSPDRVIALDLIILIMFGGE